MNRLENNFNLDSTINSMKIKVVVIFPKKHCRFTVNERIFNILKNNDFYIYHSNFTLRRIECIYCEDPSYSGLTITARLCSSPSALTKIKLIMP